MNLADLLEPTQEAISTREYEHRLAIERAHGNDDGTEQHWHRQHGDRSLYRETNGIPDDRDPVEVLACQRWGLTQRTLNRCYEQGIVSIADLRLRVDEIEHWRQCGKKSRLEVIELLETLWKARTG